MDLIGKTLGQYHIVKAIGHGGMVSVFKARQPALDRYMAVKVLLPQQASTPEFQERFTREAKAIAQLNHPTIMPVIDYGQREYCYHVLSRHDRDRFHERAATYFAQEHNWLAAAYHHFERRNTACTLDLLTRHADDIINSGGVAALSQQLSRFTTTTLTPEQKNSATYTI